jgi:hypothetical protein
MRYWVTPFPLSPDVWSTLTEAGLQPWPEGVSALPEVDALLLYDSPDQLIAMAGRDIEGLTPFNLLQGFRHLLGWSEQTGLPLIKICQLQGLSPEVAAALFAGGDSASIPPVAPVSIPALQALVTLRLIEAEPDLLDCYYDLELRAVLLGRDPDLRYIDRLRQAGQEHDFLLQDFIKSLWAQATSSELEQRLASSQTDLLDARESAQLSLLQLHTQVQEEREHYLLVDGEKQRKLEAVVRELEELHQTQAAQDISQKQELQVLREELESQLAELENLVASRETELQEAREVGELSLLQLHQVQEELQHYFMADGENQGKLLARDRELDQLFRTKALQEGAHELELQVLRERLESQLAGLEKCLASRESELQEAREAGEFSLLQLHQVQEELEHYFLKARASDQLAQAQFEQLQRSQGLMLRLQPDVLPTTPYSPALAVQVLPELAAATPNSTLQAEALLNTYAASLQRASALLERARRP